MSHSLFFISGTSLETCARQGTTSMKCCKANKKSDLYMKYKSLFKIYLISLD